MLLPWLKKSGKTMPPVPVFKKEKKGEQAQPAPALKGTMNGPRETYSSNMALLLEEGKRETAKLQNDLLKKGKTQAEVENVMSNLEFLATRFITLDDSSGPFDCYPDAERLKDVLSRIFLLQGTLFKKDFAMTAGTSIFTEQFLVQSIFDWPVAQWGSIMKNVEMCASNPRLDSLFPFYLMLVAESNGTLDYTPANEACAKLPQNAKDVNGTPESLPLLPVSMSENPPTSIVNNAALLNDYIQGYEHYSSIVCNGKPVKVEASPDGGYSTDGVIVHLPASESSMGTFEKNETRLFCGLNHEDWHIRYNSFRFVLELVDASLLSQLGAKVEKRPATEPDEDGKMRDRIFLTESQGKPLKEPIEIKNLCHFLEIFPENEQSIVKNMLNVVCDGRIEFYGLNYFSGIRADYEQDQLDLIHKRPFISVPKKGIEFEQIFEYITQKTLVKTTRNELNDKPIPPEVEERAKKVTELFLSVQKNGMRSEDSLNATMKAYLELKPFIEDFAKNAPVKHIILKGWSTTPGKSADKIKIVSDPQEAGKVNGKRGLGIPASGREG